MKQIISDRQMFNRPLQNDNVYVTSEVIEMNQFCKVREGLEKGIMCEGELVNVVSKSYGHLPNEKFFYETERKLIDADLKYLTRSINRDNRSFAVDYILEDERYHINVKNGKDKIKPMIRIINSYDGSCKSAGYFGLFREVCSNSLHVAQTVLGFSVKHRGNIIEVVMPEIGNLVNNFLDNEFYTLHRKFEVLAERPITDLKNFVRITANDLKIFKYEASEKNPEPSANARLVLDTIRNEAAHLGVEPNYWLGYNAFNEIVNTKLKKSFDGQKNMDAKIFERVLEMAN